MSTVYFKMQCGEGGGRRGKRERKRGMERERDHLCDPKESLCCVLVETDGNVIQSLCRRFDYQYKQCDF